MLYNLDMTGDWKLTYGFAVGLTNDADGHFFPVEARPTFEVHFEPVENLIDPDPEAPPPPAHHARYKGHYNPVPPAHHPSLDDPGALMAETFYDDRGVYVVQLIEHVHKELQYVAVLSGYHQIYPGDPIIQIVGGWADVGEFQTDAAAVSTNVHKGNFTLVKIT